jgi:hypothetical protein
VPLAPIEGLIGAAVSAHQGSADRVPEVLGFGHLPPNKWIAPHSSSDRTNPKPISTLPKVASTYSLPSGRVVPGGDRISNPITAHVHEENQASAHADVVTTFATDMHEQKAKNLTRNPKCPLTAGINALTGDNTMADDR